MAHVLSSGKLYRYICRLFCPVKRKIPVPKWGVPTQHVTHQQMGIQRENLMPLKSYTSDNAVITLIYAADNRVAVAEVYAGNISPAIAYAFFCTPDVVPLFDTI